jgi:hypothetical protein
MWLVYALQYWHIFAHTHLPHHIMPAKPPEELTQVEVGLLSVAARILAALHSVAEHPPVAARQTYLDAKMLEEIVSTFFAFYIEVA